MAVDSHLCECGHLVAFLRLNWVGHDYCVANRKSAWQSRSCRIFRFKITNHIQFQRRFYEFYPNNFFFFIISQKFNLNLLISTSKNCSPQKLFVNCITYSFIVVWIYFRYILGYGNIFQQTTHTHTTFPYATSRLICWLSPKTTESRSRSCTLIVSPSC